MQKKSFLALVFVLLLFSTHSNVIAQTLDPEFNTLCWKLEDCNKSRAELLGKDPAEFKNNKDGWLEKEDPCNKAGWGKCLPAGQTKTNIAFGGKKTFVDIGEFLNYNYKLALGIAGILAVVMIVIAGIQWVTSGGNSEMISSAKKRIGGAMVGLLIAYLSYTILNTVNPALVNLRLPQVFLLRPFKETPEFCRDAPEDATFAKAAGNGVAVNPDIFKNEKLQFDKNKKDLDTMGCGDKYFMNNSGGLTCKGDKCAAEGESCIPFYFEGDSIDKSKSSCIKTDLIVHFFVDPTIMGLLNDKLSWWTSTLESDWLNDSVDFWGVCEADDGKKYIGDNKESWSSPQVSIKKVKGTNFNEYYMLINGLDPSKPGNKNEAFWDCETDTVKGKLVGFVLKAEMNKTSFWLGGFDSNFFPSPSYVGRWKSISENGYISLDKIKKGFYFNAPLGTDEAEYLSTVGGTFTAPMELHYDGTGWMTGCVEPGCDDSISVN